MPDVGMVGRPSLVPIAVVVLCACAQESDRDPAYGSATTAITGVVSGPAGVIAEAHVVSDPRGFEAVTDVNGAYAIDDLPEGTYRVIAVAADHGPGESELVSVSRGDEAVADVWLEAADPSPRRMSVSVLGPAGPLEGATVTAGDVFATTDALGLATLDGAPDGPFDLLVTHPRTWPRTVRGLDPEVDGPSVAVAVSGRPPEGAVEVGNARCVLCHPTQGPAQQNTPHGRAVAFDPVEPDGAFAAGWTLDLGSGASAELRNGAGGHEVVLTDGAGAQRIAPIVGWIGDPSRTSVPWSDVDGRAQPLPVAWVATDPKREVLDEAKARIVPFEPGRWFDGDGGGRDPAAREGAEASCLPCHTAGFSATVAPDGTTDLVTTWPFGEDDRFATAGVGCERCHGPGSLHEAAAVADRPWTITRPDRLDPDRADDVCAQCHAAVTSLDAPVPWPWSATEGRFQPGLDLGDFASRSAVLWSNGTTAVPAQQSDELGASPHGTGSYAVGCLDCHDPHGNGATDRPTLRAPSADNELCLGCHLGRDFDDDDDAVLEHTHHFVYEPGLGAGAGRCTGCHMPRTASWSDFGATTGAGRVASHGFFAAEPAHAIAAFDAAGETTLPAGSFPPHGCVDCHAVAAELYEADGDVFPGPYGDGTERSTHVAFQPWFEAWYP